MEFGAIRMGLMARPLEGVLIALVEDEGDSVLPLEARENSRRQHGQSCTRFCHTEERTVVSSAAKEGQPVSA
jgi:hypothetical protein